MENIYLILVIVLFALAISDLIVGVSNDAVNFLNSAIGSKAAPRYIIMLIASLGIIIGATFSSGMMEVARKGIFHPDQFMFSEIMIVFLAVMITDVILLDTFNTFGLPTSTTVSIVFELLGAAVAVAIIKVSKSPDETLFDIYKYINTAKALTIISGILLSVVISFTFGVIIQFITRLIFTFNYKKTFKYFGSIWGGIAITAITYFILIKGAKGSSFLSVDIIKWIMSNSLLLLIYSFIGWTIILQILNWFTKVNILKIIVLVGTFALAMAFAGNDLVNFIGVPLAGFKSFQIFASNPGIGADSFSMGALAGKIKTDTYMLIIAGLIMVITLWISRKARTVTQTELNLARQDIGDEKFGSTIISRLLVRKAIGFGNTFEKILPKSIVKAINNRFDTSKIEKKKKKSKHSESFDLLRASVNLAVASILISFATSLKLPLSTTYVTFMVAMGTSLSDKAWGRESAVFRITGVITVIGGWFITALAAFTVAFLVALFINSGGIIAISLLIATVIFFIIRTYRSHKIKEAEKEKDELELYADATDETIKEKCEARVNSFLNSISGIYSKNILYLAKEDRKSYKKLLSEIEKINKSAKKIKNSVSNTLDQLNIDSIEDAHYYVQVTDYLREIAHSLTFTVRPSFELVENQHKSLNSIQEKELKELAEKISKYIDDIIKIINKQNFGKIEGIIKEQNNLVEYIDLCRKNQVKRIRKKETGTKVSLLYFTILNESKNLVLQVLNLLKSQRDFIKSL